jgi:hypothetical protein
MWAKLVKRHFDGRPDWVIVKEDVPLGKRYRIGITHPLTRPGVIVNTLTGEKRKVDCIFVIDDNNSIGMMVAEMLEIEGPSLGEIIQTQERRTKKG